MAYLLDRKTRFVAYEFPNKLKKTVSVREYTQMRNGVEVVVRAHKRRKPRCRSRDI